jgi:flavin-dependent dehydrogenase
MHLQLANGDRVIIVGGGPAGCFAGLHLLELARQKGLELDILLFEPKDFSAVGPAGCNRCAGILSSRLIRGLRSLDVTLPSKVIEAEIHAYSLHIADQSFRIEQPDPDRTIISVYRGGGPRLGVPADVKGFDALLLDLARQRGVTHLRERVRKITWGEKPVVRTRDGAYEADFLVVATGVNSRVPLAPEYGYQPPKTAIMAQDEFLMPPDWQSDQVSAFFGGMPGLQFGAVIPKGRYVNVSLLGQGLRLDSVYDFSSIHCSTRAGFSPENSLCGCTPRIAVGPARNTYGDRWVAVGDAAVTRLYKDGIGSAFFTSRVAMETAVQVGVSRRAFHQKYRPYCRTVQRDNQYGRLLFALWNFTARTPTLLQAWMRAVRLEAAAAPEQRVHIRILWGMLTGDESYRSLFWLSLSPGSLANLGRGLRRATGGSHEPIVRTID